MIRETPTPLLAWQNSGRLPYSSIQYFSALKLEVHCLLGGVGGLWDSEQVELGLVGWVGVHQYKTEEDGTG